IRPFSFLNHPSTSSIVITRAFQGRYNQIQHQSPSFNHFAAPQGYCILLISLAPLSANAYRLRLFLLLRR
ncbi:MAG: hypothetical protein WBK37_07085, partial [Kiritimatiellia bacterium]